jgi:RNA polymerase sigma-B factor
VDYAEVTSMFRALRELQAGTPQHTAQRDDIISRCLPLAEHIAHRFRGRGEAHEDLVQVARVGLVHAVNRFDVETGSEFLSFAVPTMMGEVRRFFRDHGWSVKVPRRLKDLHLRLGSATTEMSQRLGRAPTASELAAELQVDREEVIEGLIAGSSYSTTSIDRPRTDGRDDGPGIAELLGDDDPGMAEIENRELLRPVLAALPDREREVLRLRFFESLTQTQIAERVGISQMHVSRLLAKTLASLREQLQDLEAGAATPPPTR